MLYTLMNKNVPVMDVMLDENTGNIIELGTIHNLEYAPPGLNPNRNIPFAADVNKWWLGRGIPASRKGIETLVQKYGENWSLSFLQKNLGLSLSDQYWINSVAAPVKWKEINFFENDFSEDLGKAIFNGSEILLNFEANCKAPDFTSEGYLPKRWKIANGKRVLLKTGDWPYFQEPCNEVIASRFLAKLGFNHVEYVLGEDGDKQVSICENFITKNTELVTVMQLLNSYPKTSETMLEHFYEVFERLDMPNWEDDLDKMLINDFLINNVDRHFRNFGVIRNVETLEYIGVAPIFDNGNSLWYQQQAQDMEALMDMKPFYANPDYQLELVKNFEGVDIGKIYDAETVIREEFAKNRYMTEERTDEIVKQVNRRIKKIEIYL